MKNAKVAILALMMTTISLAGCIGGDDTDNSEDVSPDPPAEILGDWDVY